MDEYYKALIDQLRSNQSAQHARMANAPDSLLDTLAQYGVLDDQSALEMLGYKEGRHQADTPIPQGQMVRDMYVAPSPVAVAAAALQQALGGQKSNAALQAMQANLLRRAQSNRQIGGYERDLYRQQMAQEAAANAPPPQSTTPANDPIGGGRGAGFINPPFVTQPPATKPPGGLRPTGKKDSLGNPIFVDEYGNPQGGPMHDLSTGRGF